VLGHLNKTKYFFFLQYELGWLIYFYATPSILTKRAGPFANLFSAQRGGISASLLKFLLISAPVKKLVSNEWQANKEREKWRIIKTKLVKYYRWHGLEIFLPKPQTW